MKPIPFKLTFLSLAILTSFSVSAEENQEESNPVEFSPMVMTVTRLSEERHNM